MQTITVSTPSRASLRFEVTRSRTACPAHRSGRRQGLVFPKSLQIVMEFGKFEKVDSFALQRQVGSRRFTAVAGAQNGNMLDHRKTSSQGSW